MVAEIRRIFFDFGEACAAFAVELSREAGTKNRVINFDIENVGEGQARVVLAVQDDANRQTQQMKEETFIVESLVAWCLRNKIALPKTGEKKIGVPRKQKGVCLDITVRKIQTYGSIAEPA